MPPRSSAIFEKARSSSNQRGRPVAVILTAEAYEQMEQAVAKGEAKQVPKMVKAGLSSYGAGRTSPQAAVAQRVRACRRKK